MGWTPQEVRALSLSDFAAAFEGWAAVNSPTKEGPDYSPEEVAKLDAIVEHERVKAWMRKWRSNVPANSGHGPDEGNRPAKAGPA